MARKLGGNTKSNERIVFGSNEGPRRLDDIKRTHCRRLAGERGRTYPIGRQRMCGCPQPESRQQRLVATDHIILAKTGSRGFKSEDRSVNNADDARSPLKRSLRKDQRSSVEQRIRIEGTGETGTYDITVTGSLEDDPAVEFDASANVSGRNAEGTVQNRTHGFRFDGDLTDLTITGDAVVTVTGGVIDRYPGTEYWTIAIDASPDATGRTYQFEVTGAVEHVDGRPANDAGGRMAGRLDVGGVRYRFSDELVRLVVTGPGTVALAPAEDLD